MGIGTSVSFGGYIYTRTIEKWVRVSRLFSSVCGRSRSMLLFRPHRLSLPLSSRDLIFVFAFVGFFFLSFCYVHASLPVGAPWTGWGSARRRRTVYPSRGCGNTSRDAWTRRAWWVFLLVCHPHSGIYTVCVHDVAHPPFPLARAFPTLVSSPRLFLSFYFFCFVFTYGAFVRQCLQCFF